jgi:hypothetical protein
LHRTERELLSELTRRTTWLKYQEFLKEKYFKTPEARKLRRVLARLHKQGDKEVLPRIWIKKALGGDPKLEDPMPEKMSCDFVVRTLLNSRTLHWHERLQDMVESEVEIDLTPMRLDLVQYERDLNGMGEKNGAGPLRAFDVIQKKDWKKSPRTPTFLHAGLDEYLDGGVGPGQLCVLQAPPKNGKSSFLYTIAYRAAREGMYTYIFSCENYEDQVGERLEQIHKSNGGTQRNFPKDRLMMDYRFSPCLSDLEHQLNQIPRLDMLVLDYADNMRATRTDGPDFVWTIDELYDGIRHLARERNAVAWTATQERDPVNPWVKKSTRKGTYGSDKKIQKCDFFLGVQAHPLDNTATLTVLGRRGRGKVGEDFECFFDQDTCELTEL